tara:strand:+ start:1105 stop:1953 length:849 start_codon:yes stop_codon:yes gene_type:complete
MVDKPSLNKGLEALLGNIEKPNQAIIKNIETNKIKPNRYQPRGSFDENKLTELADSIKRHGVLSPIIVREAAGDSYEIIAGERRYRAAKLNQLKIIPCIIETAENQQSLEMALIENLQREDLNAAEEARGYDRLKREFGLTQEEISQVTGKARSTIANTLRILKLPAEVVEMLDRGKLERGHAKILVTLDDVEATRLAKKIAKEDLTIRDLANNIKSKTNKTTHTKQQSADVERLCNELSETIGHKVTINEKSKKTGQIMVHYFSADERENIIKKINKITPK